MTKHSDRNARIRLYGSFDWYLGITLQRIFYALRVSGTVNSFEVASQAMRDKGLDPENDKPTRTDFVRRVALALGDMQRKGKVEKIGRGRALRWRLLQMA
jgi:hypothetical protein